MKTVLITGGSTGIGEALVKYFTAKGDKVLFTGRKQDKAQKLLHEAENKPLFYYQVDFADLGSVQQCAALIAKEHGNIDVLINNAGTWEMEFKESKNGIEWNFAVNHLAPMLFTLKLLPYINPEKGRIINTSSGAHRRNVLDLADIEWRHKNYDGIATYSQSKLCNIYFSLILANKLANSKILVNTVHPGFVKTELFANMGERNWLGVPCAAEGARSAIFAAEDEQVVKRSKLYIYHEAEDPNLSSLAQDESLAQQVWDLSMKYLKNVV